MQALVWILRFFIVVILVWFAVKNSQLIDVHGFPEQKWQAPLVFVLLVTFVAGVVIGLLAWIPTVVRQRRELGRLRKALDREAAVASISTPEAGHAPLQPVAVETFGTTPAGRGAAQNLKRLLFPLYCWLLAQHWSYSTGTAPALPSSQSRSTTNC